LNKKETKQLKPEPVLKDFWSDNYRFADLFNQVFFRGAPVIDPDQLIEQDIEESTVFWEQSRLNTLSRFRDVMKQYGDGIDLVLIGLENQINVHYAMPVRSMLYDSLRYTRQCKKLEQVHRKAKDLKESDEFLSGISKNDRIRPVINLVVYYGEKAWDGPVTLSDMMDIPSDFEPLFNDQRINLLEAANPGTYSFSHEDNQDFFTLIKYFYDNDGCMDMVKFKAQFSDKDIYWETMAALGAATKSSKLIDYAQENKGGRVNMCTALDNLRLEGVQEGIQTGIQTGIQLNQVYLIRENFRRKIPAEAIAAFMELDNSTVEQIGRVIRAKPEVSDEELVQFLTHS